MRPRTFCPGLVIEVTRACDRACAGCYAPNVLMKNGNASSVPGLFLSPEALQAALESLPEQPRLVAIRGGEPSLHDGLENLLKMVCERTGQVVLETHGRWILEESPRHSLKTLSHLGVTVKISFDRMHGLSVESLRQITQRLEENKVKVLIAITEPTGEGFELAASSIASFVDRSNLIFQKKATQASELVKPRIGVIDSNGKLKLSLTSKPQAFDTRNVTLGRLLT